MFTILAEKAGDTKWVYSGRVLGDYFFIFDSFVFLCSAILR